MGHSSFLCLVITTLLACVHATDDGAGIELEIIKKFSQPVEMRVSQRTDKAGVFMTLATSSEYAVSAMVLAYSILRSQTTYSLVCMVTSGVPEAERRLLEKLYDRVVLIEPIAISGAITEHTGSWTKLRAFEFEGYPRVVYLGADTLVLRNIDELFHCNPLPCAAIDMFLWETTIFGPTVNGDVVVLRPNRRDFLGLVQAAQSWNQAVDEFSEVPKTWSYRWEPCVARVSTYLGPCDQALLNRYFALNMTVLPHTYNFMPYVLHQHRAAPRSFLQPNLQLNIHPKVLHYAVVKPWPPHIQGHPEMQQWAQIWMVCYSQMIQYLSQQQ